MPENAGDQTSSGDPLKTLGDALETVAQVARDGAAGTGLTVNDTLPAAGRFLSRLMYTTCYAFSYGLVFPTALLVKSIPANNAVVHGFVDGAQAAKEMVEQLRQQPLAAAAARSDSSLHS
jgi:hypothetical protein